MQALSEVSASKASEAAVRDIAVTIARGLMKQELSEFRDKEVAKWQVRCSCQLAVWNSACACICIVLAYLGPLFSYGTVGRCTILGSCVIDTAQVHWSDFPGNCVLLVRAFCLPRPGSRSTSAIRSTWSRKAL